MPDPPSRILVIGSANVDLVARVPHLPARGETVTGGTFQQAMGGKGANQAVAARRAGAAVTFFTAIGTDSYGTDVIDAMRTERIDITGILTDPDQPTGVALILVGSDGENSIAVASGANLSLRPEHLEAVLTALPTYGMLLLQNEIAPATLQAILAAARSTTVPILLNYAPAGTLTPAQLAGPYTTLVVNQHEARTLLDTLQRSQPVRQPNTTPPESPTAETSPQDTARQLHAQGFAAVILTLGAQGSICATATEILTIPAMPVRAVDTTAAGDSFCGALAAQLVRNIPLPAALHFASAAAALATTRHGAQPSLPARRQIEAALAVSSQQPK